jgi:beta-lactamase superfamily II metal-dependent hydrolase
MFKLHAVQAEEGDSLLLEYGTPSNPLFILVDGGPKGIYRNHLRGVLESLSRRDLELVILSHVDQDHVAGLLDLFSALFEQQVNEQPLLVKPKALWHNAFSQTLSHEVQQRLANALANAPNQAALQSTQAALASVNEGSRLRGLATSLNVPVNPGFGKNPICVDTQGAPFQSENLSLTVVGPTQRHLASLQKDWARWLAKNEDLIASGKVEPLAMEDESVPNLSSIVLVAEADGRTILLTGDARGDFIVEGLAATGYMRDADGRAHFDCLKVQHHGSDRNSDLRFFEQVTADHYVISANGKHGNPDPGTLEWILEAAQKQQRRFTLHVTNSAEGLKAFTEKHPPAKSGYTLNLLEPGQHALTLSLA